MSIFVHVHVFTLACACNHMHNHVNLIILLRIFSLELLYDTFINEDTQGFYIYFFRERKESMK